MASVSSIAQQSQWPKSFYTNGSIAKFYEPQPESYQGDLLKVRAAISLLRNGQTDPVFGVLWADVTINPQNNMLNWQKVTVTNIKFPGEASDNEIAKFRTDLEKAGSAWNVSFSKDELNAQLASSEKESQLSSNLRTNPPKIIYTKKPSILVTIDGEPEFNANSEWGVEQVINTPFTLVKNTDQQYYLYGNKRWYRSVSITGPWSMVSRVPSRLNKMDQAVRTSDTSTSSKENIISDIIVSTESAELIQSDGEARFTPIHGTNLLYMSNTSNDIFMDVNSQSYFVLISGRWYKAPNLNSQWLYMASDNLPADFAKIPEGSPKDVVLANVAGTDAANESVMEAQLPQTAKVDRNNASASVTYDGDPSFENIQGTDLKYAVNTPGTVLNSGRKYYFVDNGVWFWSNSANGPWIVATERPAEVENIPPSYPVYNAKYVYIYDATADYVYMGYTPGYLGNYVYGPTIVYGTGYYYRPWRGRYYYPRAYTWGFNMRYNPWTGWNFGLNFWGGWFGGYDHFHRGSMWGGWWGPSIYRPDYYRPYTYSHGYYGRNVVVNNYTVFNNNRSANIYRNRTNVVTHDRPRYDYSRDRVQRPSPNNNNAGYNGRYNNGRVIPGNNSNSNDNNAGNRPQDQRPTRAPQQGDSRQVTRPYNPDSRPQGNSNNLPNRNNSGVSDGRPGGLQQVDQNGRIITPGNSGNGSSGRTIPRAVTAPNGNSNNNNNVPDNYRPLSNRPVIQSRPTSPVNESPRVIQDRPTRVAEDRNSSPARIENRPQTREVERILTRPSGNAPSVGSPAPRVERPSGGGIRSNEGGTSRPERNSTGRPNRDR